MASFGSPIGRGGWQPPNQVGSNNNTNADGSSTPTMTAQQAQQMLASGQGTADQLAQANSIYYGSRGGGANPANNAGAYSQNQSVQNANPTTPTNQPYTYNAPTGQPVPSSITQGIQAGVNSPAAWVGQGQNSYIYDQNYNQASQQYGNQFNPQGFNNYWNALTNGGQPGQFNANAGSLASYMGVNPNSVQIGSGMGQAQLLANQNAAQAGQQLPYANLGTNGPNTYTPGGGGGGQAGNVGAPQPNPQQVMASNGGNGSNGSLNPNQNPPIQQPQQLGILPNRNQQFNGPQGGGSWMPGSGWESGNTPVNGTYQPGIGNQILGGMGGSYGHMGGYLGNMGGFNSWGNPLQGNPFSYMTGQPNNWSQLFQNALTSSNGGPSPGNNGGTYNVGGQQIPYYGNFNYQPTNSFNQDFNNFNPSQVTPYTGTPWSPNPGLNGNSNFREMNPLANSGYGNMGGYLSLLGNMARYPQMQSSPFGGSFGGMF